MLSCHSDVCYQLLLDRISRNRLWKSPKCTVYIYIHIHTQIYIYIYIYIYISIHRYIRIIIYWLIWFSATISPQSFWTLLNCYPGSGRRGRGRLVVVVVVSFDFGQGTWDWVLETWLDMGHYNKQPATTDGFIRWIHKFANIEQFCSSFEPQFWLPIWPLESCWQSN